MLAWLKRFFGSFYAAHIDPPTFGPYATRAEAQFAAGNRAATVGGTVLETSGTPSMVPLIPAKVTLLVMKPIPFAEARLGSVVTYRSPLSQSSVTHRLVARDSGGFIPSGDGNRWSEANYRVTAGNFLGEIVGIYPFTA